MLKLTRVRIMKATVNYSLVTAIVIAFIFGLLAAYFFISVGGSLSKISPAIRSYDNEERWDVVKDEKGRVQSVVVHRSAREK